MVKHNKGVGMVTQKKVFVGWICKTQKLSKIKADKFPIWPNKDTRDYWGFEDWPPRKVRVTVEYLD